MSEKKARAIRTKELREQRSQIIKDIAAKQEIVSCARSLLNAYRWVKSGSSDIRSSYYVFRGREVRMVNDEEKNFRDKQFAVSGEFLRLVEAPLEAATRNYEKHAGDLAELENRLKEVRGKLRAIYSK